MIVERIWTGNAYRNYNVSARDANGRVNTRAFVRQSYTHGLCPRLWINT
jgi:hypothetical protein